MAPMARFGGFLGVALGVGLVGFPGGPVLGQADPPPERLTRASAAYSRGDHAAAWFGFWGLAREGHPAAQFNLGQLYREGHGVPPDLTYAHFWYAEAAAQGHAFAQFNLGMMYERGDGVPADPIEAKAWYRRAAAQDVPGARTALERLEKPAPARSGRLNSAGGLVEAGR